MSRVSIIIPVYNPDRSVIRCLKSVYKQTISDYEVIVLDDGSTDESFMLVEKYLNNHPEYSKKTRVIRKKNSGVADTRNYGMSLATGNYLAFIDQDDFVAKTYLEKYISFADSGKYDVICGGYERIAKNGCILKRVIPRDTEWGRYVVTAPWAHLYKREFLIKNNVHFLDNSIGEDVYLNVVLNTTTDKFKCINNADYKWFFNESSVSNSKQNTLNDDVDVIKLLDSIYSDSNDSVYLQYFFLRYVCWYLLFSSRGSNKRDIDEAYGKCFRWIKEHYPDYRKNKYIGFRMPKGEDGGTHLFVLLFYFAEKLRLLKPFLKLFGKKKLENDII